MLPKIPKKKRNIYLDHAATTYLDPDVEKAMRPFWSQIYGNPSSLYEQGRQAKLAIDGARGQIAKILNCRPDEVIFNAGGTESVNQAIFGVVRDYQSKMRLNPVLPQPHIMTSEIEHHAVLHSFEALENEGVETSYISVDKFGFVDPDEIIKSIQPNTILVSIMYANNEIGTIQRIAEIGRVLKKVNENRLASTNPPDSAGQPRLPKILFHTDACQAAGTLDIDIQKLGVDLFSMNGSKIYGPKQTGLLYIKSGIRLRPLIYGGGQEKNLRSGTENVPGIIGLAWALELAQKNRVKENARLRKLRDYFIERLMDSVPKVLLNGAGIETDSEQHPARLPNNINVSILDIEGEALLLYLDAYGISMSTGSACASTSLDPSHVILAIGRPYEYAHGSMRFTLGKKNSKKDIDYVMSVLPQIVEQLRAISPVNLDPQNPQQITMEKAFVGENMDKFRNQNLKN